MLMHLNGFDLLMIEDRYLFKTLPDLSHSHGVTATVPRVFSNTHIFGYESMAQAFNAFFTE